MSMYSYDQVLTDVRQVYEQLTGLQAPKIDTKNPKFPIPKGVDPIALVQNEINQMNLYLVSSGISLRLSKTPTWSPRAEVYETPQEYVIKLELAGVSEADVKIQNIDSILIVRGTRQFRRDVEDAQYHTSERAYGMFERFFPLPNSVQPDNLHTRMSHGILEIVLPKIGASAGSAAPSRRATPIKAEQEAASDKERKK
jgi:HSP20 family molecular chaperone IbpA